MTKMNPVARQPLLASAKPPPTSTASKASPSTPRINPGGSLHVEPGRSRTARQLPASTASLADTQEWSVPPHRDISDTPTVSPDAPSNSLLRDRPNMQQAARAWMTEQIHTHLRHRIHPAWSGYIDPSEVRLAAFTDKQAADALDTRYLISDIGLDEIPLHLRPQTGLSLTAEGRRMGVYHESDLESEANLYSVAPPDDSVRNASVKHSRFPADLLLNAMNGLTRYPDNGLGSLLLRNHVPVSAEFRQDYVRTYVKGVTGHDVDPKTTYLIEFSPTADQEQGASHRASGLSGSSDIQGGYSLLQLFEQHMAPANKLPGRGGRFRLVSSSDLELARRAEPGHGDRPTGGPAMWSNSPLPVNAFLDMLARLPAERLFPQEFRREQLEPYWENNQDLLAELDETRAYSHAQQAYDAGDLSAEQFKLVDRAFTEDERSDDIEVYPVNFAGLPTTDRFVGMRIEQPDTGLKVLYFPRGAEAIRAFPLDKTAGEAGQLEQMQQWLAGKVRAASWTSAITGAGSGSGAPLYTELNAANQTPLSGNVFKALTAERIKLDLTHPEGFIRSATGVQPLHTMREKWQAMDYGDFAAMDLSRQRDYLLDQYPPMRELASEYARSFLSRQFNKDINPDTTYLTVFPEKSFLMEAFSGSLTNLLTTANGNPSSTVELAKKVSLTDLFLENWAPHEALLLGWNRSKLFRILSAPQVATEDNRHNYRNAVNVIDPTELFRHMMGHRGQPNRFASTYGALIDTYWKKNARYLAEHARQLALQTVQESVHDTGVNALDQRDRDILRDVFSNRKWQPSHIRINAVGMNNLLSLNAMLIEDDAGKRNYLYLPGAPDGKLSAFAETEPIQHWLAGKLASEPWRDQFLRQSFPVKDARKLAGVTAQFFTRHKNPTDPHLGQQRRVTGNPFKYLVGVQAARDKDDVTATTRDNDRLRTAATVDFFTNLQIPLTGGIAGLAAGEEEVRREAPWSLGYDVAGLALGLGAGKLIGTALKPLVGTAFRSTVKNIADAAVGVAVPVSGDYFKKNFSEGNRPLAPGQQPPGLAPLPQRHVMAGFTSAPVTNPYITARQQKR